MNPEYTTITAHGTLYGADGFATQTGVTVTMHIERDGSVIYSVGRSAYPAHELTVADNSLTHVNGWAVKWSVK